MDVDDETLVRAAQEALTRPCDFGYWGGLDLFGTWGLTFTWRPDGDDLIGESNFRVALRELQAAAVHADDGGDGQADDGPEALVQVVHCGGFYGNVDHLAVRVLKDGNSDITPDNITGVFAKAVELAGRLEEYPFLDEDDHSYLESEAMNAHFEEEWQGLCNRWYLDEDGPEPTDDEKQQVRERICDRYSGTDGWPDLEDVLAEVREWAAGPGAGQMSLSGGEVR